MGVNQEDKVRIFVVTFLRQTNILPHTPDSSFWGHPEAKYSLPVITFCIVSSICHCAWKNYSSPVKCFFTESVHLWQCQWSSWRGYKSYAATHHFRISLCPLDLSIYFIFPLSKWYCISYGLGEKHQKEEDWSLWHKLLSYAATYFASHWSTNTCQGHHAWLH